MKPAVFQASLFALCLVTGLTYPGTAVAGGVDPIIQNQVMLRMQPGQDVSPILTDYPDFALSLVAGRAIPGRGIFLLQIGSVPPGESETSIALLLQADPRVLWAEANYFGDAPEGSARSFYFNRMDVPDAFHGQPAFGEIGLAGAAFGQATAANQTIAVIDTGLDASHPLVAGFVLPGLNLLDHSTDVAEIPVGADNDHDGDVDEMLGHGTHVATLVEYVAPGGLLLPIRAFDTEGNGDNYLVGQAIFEALDRGATVINLSAGSTYRGLILEDAVDEARARGSVVVAAAGNLNRQDPPEYPAMDPEAVGVAALDGLVRAPFSNYHAEVDVCAPGVAVYGGIPDGAYAAWSGTSFATPMVSGVAARILSRHPEWSAAQYRADNVRVILRGTAANVDALNPGFGGLLGGGLLDAYAAVFEPPAFTAASTLASADAPIAFAAGDLDRDGDNDLVVLNTAPSSARILVGDGSGGFTPGAQLPAGNGADLILVVDLNADQAPEIVLNGDGGLLRIYTNNGVGEFGAATFAGAGAAPSALAAADVDRDGLVDLVVATESSGGAVRILQNAGGGTIVAQPWMPVGPRPVSIALARLNADVQLDIVTANRTSDTLSVLLSTGSDLNYATAVEYSSGGAEPRSVVTTDLDQDGAVDLVAGNADDRNIAVRWNDGLGGFGGQPLVLAMPESRGPQLLMVADVTCDGMSDVLILNGELSEGFVSALVNRGNRSPLGILDWETGVQPEAIVAADLDGDGVPDLATAGVLSGDVTLHRNISCSAPGDMNCDHAATVADIGGFVRALADPALYWLEYPNCRRRNADMNADGQVTVSDIGTFVALLTQ